MRPRSTGTALLVIALVIVTSSCRGGGEKAAPPATPATHRFEDVTFDAWLVGLSEALDLPAFAVSDYTPLMPGEVLPLALFDRPIAPAIGSSQAFTLGEVPTGTIEEAATLVDDIAWDFAIRAPSGVPSVVPGTPPPGATPPPAATVLPGTTPPPGWTGPTPPPGWTGTPPPGFGP